MAHKTDPMNLNEYIDNCKSDCLETLIDNWNDPNVGSMQFDQAAFSRALADCERNCEDIEEAPYHADTESNFFLMPTCPPIVQAERATISSSDVFSSSVRARDIILAHGTISQVPLFLNPGLVIFEADDEDNSNIMERRAMSLQQELLRLPNPIHTMLQTTLFPSRIIRGRPRRLIRLVIMTGDPNLRYSYRGP